MTITDTLAVGASVLSVLYFALVVLHLVLESSWTGLLQKTKSKKCRPATIGIKQLPLSMALQPERILLLNSDEK